MLQALPGQVHRQSEDRPPENGQRLRARWVLEQGCPRAHLQRLLQRVGDIAFGRLALLTTDTTSATARVSRPGRRATMPLGPACRISATASTASLTPSASSAITWPPSTVRRWLSVDVARSSRHQRSTASVEDGCGWTSSSQLQSFVKAAVDAYCMRLLCLGTVTARVRGVPTLQPAASVSDEDR